MTHLILQFALRIAFRGVLHRCGNQEIHRWKISSIDICFCFQAEAIGWLGQKKGENLRDSWTTVDLKTNAGVYFCGYVC